MIKQFTARIRGGEYFATEEWQQNAQDKYG